MPPTRIPYGNKGLRILIGPVEIAGYYSQLAQGFTDNGINVKLIQRNKHKFEYGKEHKQPYLVVFSQYLTLKKERYFHHSALKFLFGFASEFFWTLWAITAIYQFNTFIFGFGHSLLPRNIDLPILKVLKKTVIMNLAHGSEARPPYFDGTWQTLDASKKEDALAILKSTKKIYRLVRRVQKNATFMIGAAYSTSPFAKEKFINSIMVGIPFSGLKHNDHSREFPDETENFNAGSNGIRILHSPSNRLAKGSDLIATAIGELQAEGISIDYLELSGVSNSKVLQAITKCDLVIDQTFSDGPLPGFATEAAYFGKPSIVGGYGLEQLKNMTPVEIGTLSFTCEPRDIKAVIKECISSPLLLGKMGSRAQEFVLKNWNPKTVAQRYVDIINHKIPGDWWLDPADIVYVAGCGQDLETTRRNIRALVEHFGASSLKLSNNPKLLRATLDMAEIHLD
jgi:glycosyltransferase involved in cell wall biosynthesis